MEVKMQTIKDIENYFNVSRNTAITEKVYAKFSKDDLLLSLN